MDSDSRCVEWLPFYRDFFPDPESSIRFVRDCEFTQDLRHPSRLIMHQCCRLISVARDLREIRPHDESFQIFLFIVCCEAVAKLHQLREGESGSSKAAVVRFFEELLPDAEQARLTNGLRNIHDERASVAEVARELYKVRNGVAHEGDTWSVILCHDGVPTMSRGWSLIAGITLEEVEDIVVQGCIAAAVSRLGERDLRVPDGDSDAAAARGT